MMTPEAPCPVTSSNASDSYKKAPSRLAAGAGKYLRFSAGRRVCLQGHLVSGLAGKDRKETEVKNHAFWRRGMPAGKDAGKK